MGVGEREGEGGAAVPNLARPLSPTFSPAFSCGGALVFGHVSTEGVLCVPPCHSGRGVSWGRTDFQR